MFLNGNDAYVLVPEGVMVWGGPFDFKLGILGGSKPTSTPPPYPSLTILRGGGGGGGM